MTTRAEDDDLDALLLERYCTETASLDEWARMEAWFGQHQDQRDWYEQLKAGLKKGDAPYISPEQGRAAKMEIIQAALRQRAGMMKAVSPAGMGDQRFSEYPKPVLALGPSTVSDEHGGVGRTARSGIFKAQPLRRGIWTTTAVLLSGCLLFAFNWIARTRTISGHAAQPGGAATTYVTGNGERATITLPDGSTVVLNVASRLDVPTDYLAGHRTVRLVGEGMFTVPHQDETPLTVHAGAATVRVLGTSFLVRAYPADSLATVAVREGKVAVQSVVLTAAQQLSVGRTGANQVRAADPAQFAFVTGVLTLDKVTFSQAIAELDRWYNADIRLGDPRLARLRVTGDFRPGSVADLAEYLEFVAYDVRVVRNGRILTLYPR